MSQSPVTTTELTDTRVMYVLHRFFRREFRLAGGVIRACPAGDRDRAAEVADHLDFVGTALHHHHTIEDVMLWPVLLERVPDELAPIVRLMESQHERVEALLAEINDLLPRFRATAEAADRDRLASVFDTLYVNLAEHLDAEEERLLPIAARNVSQQEWDAMGTVGREQTPRSQQSLTFGMFLYDGDPEVVLGMLHGAPAPVRWLVPRLGRRAFRKHAERIHGTPTP